MLNANKRHSQFPRQIGLSDQKKRPTNDTELTGKLGRLRILTAVYSYNEGPSRVVLRTPDKGKRIFGFSQILEKPTLSLARNAATIAQKGVSKKSARSISMRIKKKQAS
jgi:hypothetical protein